ncbi:MAG: hypothetical protein GQ546_03375 [Gammaproteobacteria bacterium]|nr:hypothetical protein [Gammaproteobacteria bacterium]
MALKRRLEKLENQQQKSEQSGTNTESVLWNIATRVDGTAASSVAALKELNRMKTTEQEPVEDSRSEAEIRDSIEALIEEYRDMPDI